MKTSPFAILATVAFGLAATAAGGATILDANFDEKPADVTIGTGGAIAGEPTYVGAIGGTVRTAPFATRCVEIVDGTALPFGDSIRFQFVDNAEIVEGTVTISVNLWFDVLGNYAIHVYPPGGVSRLFLQLRLLDDGSVLCRDENTATPVPVGSYTAGAAVSLVITQYLDLGTYDVSWDGTMFRQSESHGITDRGIGAVTLGTWPDADADGLYWVDDVVVSATAVPTALEPVTWGQLKAVYRVEGRT